MITEQPQRRDHVPTWRADVSLLVMRVVAGAILAIHGLQNLSDPAGHIAGTAAFGVPFAPVTAWLSMLGEAGLGVLLMIGIATRVAGALATCLMLLTWLSATLAEGLITDQPGINSEIALLLAAVGATVAMLGGGRCTLGAALRLPGALR